MDLFLTIEDSKYSTGDVYAISPILTLLHSVHYMASADSSNILATFSGNMKEILKGAIVPLQVSIGIPAYTNSATEPPNCTTTNPNGYLQFDSLRLERILARYSDENFSGTL